MRWDEEEWASCDPVLPLVVVAGIIGCTIYIILDEMRMSGHLAIQFCHRWLWLVSRVAPCQISDWKLAHLPKGAQGYIHNPFYSAQWTDSMSAKQSTKRFYSTQSFKLTLRLGNSWKTRLLQGVPKSSSCSFLVLVPWALCVVLVTLGTFGHFK